MDVVTGAMGTLLPLLGNLLKEEYNLQKNTRREIQFLKDELESMEAALIKISEAPLDHPPDNQVKLWARDVRDLSYEIEDNIDKFRACLEFREQKKPYSFMGFIHRIMDMMTKGKIRRNIGIDTKDIKNRIKEIGKRRDRYKVDSIVPKPTGTSTSTDTLRQHAFFQEATELIGTKEKSIDIVRMLKKRDKVSKKQLKISIVGFGGLGKTTLGNLVYESLRADFDCWAFIPVSLNPNMVKIFKSLLYQFDKYKYKNIMYESSWCEIQLIREIRQILSKKRYLILIDDIWDKSVWKIIRSALVENECGSTVIATTRIMDVAKEVGGVYQLKPLSIIDSRRLFNQRIFGSQDKNPPDRLVEVSENILRKCGGVPLAIMTLASMLAGKGRHSYTYWYEVYKSMGSGLANNPDLRDMRRILYVSYYDLPPNLRTCLLYLSLYPEDYRIQVKALILKWIGEGFIHEEHGIKSLYEVGEAYIDELINRSLIQPMDTNIANRPSSFCVHDMVLDLITSLSNDENFLTTLGGEQHSSVPRTVRRLSLQNSKEEDVNQMSLTSLSSVRSLTVFCTTQGLSAVSTLAVFSVLRTLDLSGCRGVDNHHLKDICNLFHLRYLSLEWTSITDIPKDIAKLQLLQVLDIRSFMLGKLPSTFVQLRQLVFLEMGYRTVCASILRLMPSLPLVSFLTIRIKLSEENLQALGSMPALRDLSIDVHDTDQDREKRLVIGNFQFPCLTRLHIQTRTTNFMFAQRSLQMLQILQLDFSRKEGRLGHFHFGLENLPSLDHVYVETASGGAPKEAMSNGLRKELRINPNKPTLTVKVLTRTYRTVRPDPYKLALMTANGITGSMLSLEE